MALRKRGKWRYGDTQADIRKEILRYSEENEYVAEHFANAICKCRGKVFHLYLDDDQGAAVRECVKCGKEHPVGDSKDYLDDAELGECTCPCGGNEFEITAGVSLYEDSEDVRWIYIGCRCRKCKLTAVYGDWKNEFNGYRKLLAKI
jgi:hypothetical protein